MARLMLDLLCISVICCSIIDVIYTIDIYGIDDPDNLVNNYDFESDLNNETDWVIENAIVTRIEDAKYGNYSINVTNR